MRLSSIIVAATLAFAAAAAAQEAPELVRTPMGDWTKICNKEGTACLIEQVGKTAAGEEALRIQIEKLPEPQDVGGQRIESLAIIRVPLGVILTEGLKLKIDQGEVSESPYLTCQPGACVVRAPLQASLLASFKGGAKAQFSFTVFADGQPQQVPIDISLSGFTRAYDSL